jgi:hypothetical protein
MKKLINTLALAFESFYDSVGNAIGGGKSYAPRETKW